MARFLCCTRQSSEGAGGPVWINVDLVTSIEVDKFGLGSKVSFGGHDAAHYYVQEKPHEIFERPATEVKSSGRG